jgi:hypothetical protein
MDWYSRKALAGEVPNTLDTDFRVRTLNPAVEAADRAKLKFQKRFYTNLFPSQTHFSVSSPKPAS